MIIFIESTILCLLFTTIVFIISRNPIKTIYNYPPKIIERVKSIEEYKDKIPTNENKIVTKLFASIIFLLLISFILRYVNNCKTFTSSFLNGYLLWTIVNFYDFLVLDVIWFCHDKYFIIKETEDMKNEYHNYLFHFKGFLIGEGLGLIICLLASLIIEFIL